MIKVLVTGNRYIMPEMVADEIKKLVADTFDLDIEIYKFENIPNKEYYLYDETVIPSGMAIENPNIAKPKVEGIREYYGDPYALKDMIKGVELLIMYGNGLPKEVIDEADKLKAVLVMRGGPVNVDKDYLEKKGIAFYHTEGRNASSVAELTIGLLIGFMRHIPYSNNSLKHNVWTLKFNSYDMAGTELTSKTVGLIGFGKIAQKLCRILLAFDCKVLVYDPFVSPDIIRSMGAEPSEIPELLKNSDIVSLHARRKKGEPPLIGENEIGMMKKDAILVNTARGMLLDYSALKDALKNGRIQGAVLDVFGDEPFSFYKELIHLPNVLCTSHIGGISKETAQRGAVLTAKQTLDILNKHFL